MLYVLLILPHITGMAWLLALALRSDSAKIEEDPPEGGDGGLRRKDPPPSPPPGSGDGGLPLLNADPPRRRMRVGEDLADLHPRPRRRDHGPQRAPRTPAER